MTAEPMTLIQEVITVEDTECPHEDGPYHFWTCDGPFSVSCDNCGADGKIVQTTEPELDEEDEDDE